MQKTNLIPQIALAVMLAISVVIGLVFFFGGDVDPNAEYVEPNFTGALLNWAYVLIGLVCFATVIAAVMGFITSIQSDPKSASLT